MTALEQHTLSLKKAMPMVAIGLLLSLLISKSDLLVPIALIIIAAVLFALFLIVRDIKWGFYLLIMAGFFSVGVTRYAPLPLGLMIDFILVGIFLIYFFKEFKKLDWSRLQHPVFFAVFAWMVINVMEIVNPESRSFEAWFYAMRGVSLYFFLTVTVGFLCLNFKRDFSWFVNIWFTCSILGTLWGMKQLYIGLDGAEQEWLNVPGNLSTHMLFGRLRVFSFYSDAGQFGASQAHTALVACILAVNEKLRGRKMFYIITSLLCFYGMLISGTRGAIAIPIIGFFTYFVLIRNWKIIIVGGLLFVSAFGVLKFTFIGQGVYQINRMRTALNPNDASFNVRLENQKKLRAYLNHHILGGGIGSAGYWGQRFSPGTFLANLALDSWYVRIAAEFGYVGLVLYLIILIVIVFCCFKTIGSTIDEYDRGRLIAIFCGLSGILVASYTNQVFGQIPTATLIYISIVFLSKHQNTEKNAKLA
jgi:ABC-type multidrug transport system fused ATPase/permease subunit